MSACLIVLRTTPQVLLFPEPDDLKEVGFHDLRRYATNVSAYLRIVVADAEDSNSSGHAAVDAQGPDIFLAEDAHGEGHHHLGAVVFLQSEILFRVFVHVAMVVHDDVVMKKPMAFLSGPQHRELSLLHHCGKVASISFRMTNPLCGHVDLQAGG